VIGNPHILIGDPHWKELLLYAVANEAYVGCPLPPLEEESRERKREEARALLEQMSLAEAEEEEEESDDEDKEELEKWKADIEALENHGIQPEDIVWHREE